MNILEGRRQSEQGVVSIMVTMVLMVVITLIVLGFAQLSRREQVQTLDRQLSQQAFFAAESGINDARYTIFKALQAGKEVQEKDDCETKPQPPDNNPTPGNPYPADPRIDAANNVEYTCLLVTTKLPDIQQSLASEGKSVTIPIKPAGGLVNRIHINWRATERPASTTGCSTTATIPTTGSFPKNAAGGWNCPFGVLRVDIVPTGPGVIKRDVLLANQKAFFLYPTRVTHTQTVDYAGPRGAVRAMACTIDGCDIDMINVGGSTEYAMRFSSIYKGGTFTVSAKDAAGAPLRLQGAQARIDATGKAQNVLRRMQVRVSLLADGGVTSEQAIQSGSSLCKRFSVIPESKSFSIPGDIVGQDTTTNPLCKSATYNPPCTTKNDIVLALDISLSMRKQWETGTRRQKLNEVAKEFVQNTNVGILNNEAIIGFATDATVYQPLTDSTSALLAAIDKMPELYGTYYVPPLQKSNQVLTGGRLDANKVLVLISDGETTENKDLVLNTARAMKDAGITIFTIGINPDNLEYSYLQGIASTGKFTSAENEAALDNILRTIAEEYTCN
ncbi:MAG TPA: VWA domain-containing protein [Candidatus Limnocylindrales bacterium]|nr:VWA domain-containing protein [Candidatus Limnocylindrales bacterium]